MSKSKKIVAGSAACVAFGATTLFFGIIAGVVAGGFMYMAVEALLTEPR